MRTRLFEDLKAMFRKSIIIWSEMGQQTAHANNKKRIKGRLLFSFTHPLEDNSKLQL